MIDFFQWLNEMAKPIKQSVKKFGYRGITDYSIVKERGIFPVNVEGEFVIYFSDHIDVAKQYGIVVRFPWPKDTILDPYGGFNTTGEGNYYITKQHIDPKYIQIQLDIGDQKFHPLLKTKMVSNLIVPDNYNF